MATKLNPNLYTHELRQYAEGLKEHPGAWAEYPGRYTYPETSLGMLRKGNYNANPAFPPSEFEFRLVGDKIHVRCRIHVE
jgi:hypothetical protein